MKTKLFILLFLLSTGAGFSQNSATIKITLQDGTKTEREFSLEKIIDLSHTLDITNGVNGNKLKLLVTSPTNGLIPDVYSSQEPKIVNKKINVGKLLQDVYAGFTADKKKADVAIQFEFKSGNTTECILTYNLKSNADQETENRIEYTAEFDYTPLNLCPDCSKKTDCSVPKEYKYNPSASNNNKLIQYDIKTNLLTGAGENKFRWSKKTVNVGNAVQLQVTNLNPYKYKVSLHAKDSLFPVEEPSLFTSAFNSSSAIGEIVKAVSGASTDTKADSSSSLIESNKTNPDVLKDQDFGQAANNLILFQAKLAMFETELENAVYTYIKEPDFIEEDKVDKLRCGMQNCIIKNFTVLDAYSSLESELQSQYFKELSKVRAAFLNLSKTSQTEQKSFYDSLTTKVSTQPLINTITLLRMIKNVKTSVVYNIPKIGNVDELFITIDMSPLEEKQENESGATADKTTPAKTIPKPVINIFPTQRLRNTDFSVPIFGGLKLDFSTGLFFSGLQNERYTLRSDSTVVQGSQGQDSTTAIGSRILKETQSSFDLGLGAFAHGYTRLTHNVNLALTLGAGINFDKQLRYMTGGTLLLGGKNKLAIGGGLIFGQVETLSKRFETEYNANALIHTSITKIDTVPVFKNSWYVSVTYSFRIGKQEKD